MFLYIILYFLSISCANAPRVENKKSKVRMSFPANSFRDTVATWEMGKSLRFLEIQNRVVLLKDRLGFFKHCSCGLFSRETNALWFECNGKIREAQTGTFKSHTEMEKMDSFEHWATMLLNFVPF